MFSFFNFNRGEWSAVIVISILFFGNILFTLFYEYKDHVRIEMDKYAEEFECFQKEQQMIADSVKKVRRERNTEFNKKSTSYQHGYRYDYTTYDTGKNSVSFQKEYYAITKLNINQCDSSELLRIPLFGSKRAAKLIEYREKLGGYYTFEQVAEIYILQNISVDHLNKYFYIDLKDIQKIAINKASYSELIKHPYFDAYLTKSIIHYREKNGELRTWEEFRNATNAYPELIKRLEHYLSFE